MTVSVFYSVIFADSTCQLEYYQWEEAILARLAVWGFDVSDSLNL
jgi:hypothetical protein